MSGLCSRQTGLGSRSLLAKKALSKMDIFQNLAHNGEEKNRSIVAGLLPVSRFVHRDNVCLLDCQ